MEVSSLTTRVISQEALLLSRPGFSHSVVDSDLQINCVHIYTWNLFVWILKVIVTYGIQDAVQLVQSIMDNFCGTYEIKACGEARIITKLCPL